jgi:shikimate dehydrogenase
MLHRAAYDALGLADWRYDALDVTSETLHAVIDGLDDSWAGLSLTMPLKHTVIPMLDDIDPVATATGAVNTVVVRPDGVVGYNTDVYGIVAALREAQPSPSVEGVESTDVDHPRAVILGAGATAASALAALQGLGIDDVTVLVRSLERAVPLAHIARRLGVDPVVIELASQDTALRLWGADVIISTLPPHAADPIARELKTLHVGDDQLLLDVAYDPLRTALGLAWAAAGGTYLGGERMLLHQAVRQVELMTGLSAPLAAMDAALQAALARPRG